jgi:KaiC/GvpD/RAD55 family RecA-like ATPase
MQMSDQKYVRLTKTLNNKGILVKPDEVLKHITDRKIDHYTSTYFYNQSHFDTFQTTGSIKGIKDVTTNKVWWDFDSKDDLKLARKDALTLIERLKGSNVDPNSLEIFFSGNKGFNVVLNLNKDIVRKQVEAVALKFAKDLKTFDTTLYDESQLLRVVATKHQNSEYYKTQLSLMELQTIKFADLFFVAKSPSQISKPTIKVDLSDDLFEVEEVKQEFKTNAEAEFDLNNKPRGWKASKWALMQGFIKSGERDNSMMILAATCKATGYDNITTYYMCKSALKKSWERYGQGDFTKEDLWAKIEQVYSPTWKGGQYSEKEDTFLQQKSNELGIKELTTNSTVGIRGGLKVLKGYAQNIDSLTLKTGIEELDKRQRITVGMSWGIIAGPGSGKTSLALQMLHSMSLNGELCIYFSYDMYLPHVIQKIIQKHWAEDIEVVFEKYKNNDFEYVKKVEELITKEYPNVEFCAESGQTIEDIRDTIREVEQARGKKCRFVVIDYNELVITDVSDPTQSSNKTAQNIRALASNEQICILSLFQPSKNTGDPSSEITSYRAAKGGSGIEQSVSLMFGVSRPGFNPRKTEGDKYVSMNCVKNRMGSVFSIDLHWEGYKGIVRSLTPTEKSDLSALRKAIEDEKNGKNNDDSWIS